MRLNLNHAINIIKILYYLYNVIERYDLVMNNIGRVIYIIIGAILIIFALPDIYLQTFGIAAAWNLFFGMILIVSSITKNDKTPLLGMLLGLLFTLRFIIILISGASIFDLLINGLVALFIILGSLLLIKSDKLRRAS